MFYWLIKILLSPIIKLFWLKKVESLRNIPKKGAFIIAANHTSYFDFIFLIVLCPRRIYFLTAEKFFESFFWRPLVVLTKQIRVDRESKDKSQVIKEAVQILNKGQVLGIFPEGTRSRTDKLQKAYNGVAKIAILARAPIVPIGFRGNFNILPPQNQFPKFGPRTEVFIGQPVFLDNYYNKNTNQEDLDYITHHLIMKNIAQMIGQEYVL